MRAAWELKDTSPREAMLKDSAERHKSGVEGPKLSSKGSQRWLRNWSISSVRGWERRDCSAWRPEGSVSIHKCKLRRPLLSTRKHTPLWGDKTLPQVAHGDGGVATLRDILKPSGHSAGRAAWGFYEILWNFTWLNYSKHKKLHSYMQNKLCFWILW